MRAGIVTMVRNVGPPLFSFIQYHLAIGFERLYIYFDDPKDTDLPAVRRFDRRVVAIPCDAAHRRRWAREAFLWPALRPFLQMEVMARQLLNTELALRRAEREGIDWLLHVDSDELLWLQGERAGPYFTGLSKLGVTAQVFRNFEAIPETDEVGDYFREVTLFKKPPLMLSAAQRRKAMPFIAYTSGKSAVRVAPGVLPHGVHRFETLAPPPSRQQDATTAFLLHYPVCGFSRYWRKYKLKGRFPDRYFGQMPITLPFHTASRDAVMAGDVETARALYRKHQAITDPVRVKRLLKEDVVVRVVAPSKLLARKPRVSASAG